MLNPYDVFPRKKARKGWQDIRARDPKGAADVLQFPQTTPEVRVPGNVKKLRGNLEGLLQYDVNYSDRIQYWVDREAHIVWIEYAGAHP